MPVRSEIDFPVEPVSCWHPPAPCRIRPFGKPLGESWAWTGFECKFQHRVESPLFQCLDVGHLAEFVPTDFWAENVFECLDLLFFYILGLLLTKEWTPCRRTIFNSWPHHGAIDLYKLCLAVPCSLQDWECPWSGSESRAYWFDIGRLTAVRIQVVSERFYCLGAVNNFPLSSL